MLCTGECWPGPVVFPDFTNESARKWWSNLVMKFVANGVDGIWNDMNEPAVFKVGSKLVSWLVFWNLVGTSPLLK